MKDFDPEDNWLQAEIRQTRRQLENNPVTFWIGIMAGIAVLYATIKLN